MDGFIEALVPQVAELRPTIPTGTRGEQKLGPVPPRLREILRWRGRGGMGLTDFGREAGQQAAQAWSYEEATEAFGLNTRRLEELYEVTRKTETPGRIGGSRPKTKKQLLPLRHDRNGAPVLEDGDTITPITTRTHEDRAKETMLAELTEEGGPRAGEGFLRQMGAMTLPGAGSWQWTTDPSDPNEELSWKNWTFIMRRAYGREEWAGRGSPANGRAASRRGALYQRRCGRALADTFGWAYDIWDQPPPERYPPNYAEIMRQAGNSGTGVSRGDHALVPKAGGAAMNVDIALYGLVAQLNKVSPHLLLSSHVLVGLNTPNGVRTPAPGQSSQARARLATRSHSHSHSHSLCLCLSLSGLVRRPIPASLSRSFCLLMSSVSCAWGPRVQAWTDQRRPCSSCVRYTSLSADR